jgi:hypothetical protein
VYAGWQFEQTSVEIASAVDRTGLWASHRNKIDVGGCTDCALAATTAAASSAILGR